ncbi:MAG: tetratricopeptide repeat protein [Saprospiraceae bacterium]|nr:tetratricopeptide repeat protein [Saprospiraceae bacterium]
MYCNPKQLCVLLAICLLPFSSRSQTAVIDSLEVLYEQAETDSLKFAYLTKLFFNSVWSNPPEAKKYAQEGIDLAIEKQEGLHLSRAYYNMGTYYNMIVKKDSARIFFQQSLDVPESNDHPLQYLTVSHSLATLERDEGEFDAALHITEDNIERAATVDSMYWGTMYDFKGQVLTSMGKNKLALQALYKSIEILEGTGKKIRIADAYAHLADAESALENYDEAITFYKKALPIYEKYNDKFYQSAIWGALGNAYNEKNDLELADAALEKAVELSEEIKQSIIQANALRTQGIVARKKKQYTTSSALLEKALAIQQKDDLKADAVSTQIELARTFVEQNKPDDALPILDSVIEVSQQEDYKLSLKTAYEIRAQAYERLNRHQAASEDHKAFIAVQNILLEENKRAEIEEQRALFDLEQKEKQITFQENEIQLLEEREKVSRLQKFLLGLGILLTTFILGSSVYLARQRNKQSKMEKEKALLELESKQRELTTHALHVAQKNELLTTLKEQINGMASRPEISGILRQIDQTLESDDDWERFRNYFESVHKDFAKNVKARFTDITQNELRLMALIKMNLSTKEMANILNVTPDSVKKARYRLRKKMGISYEEQKIIDVLTEF